jgi:hypothetical protein
MRRVLEILSTRSAEKVIGIRFYILKKYKEHPL